MFESEITLRCKSLKNTGEFRGWVFGTDSATGWLQRHDRESWQLAARMPLVDAGPRKSVRNLYTGFGHPFQVAVWADARDARRRRGQRTVGPNRRSTYWRNAVSNSTGVMSSTAS